MIRINVRNGTLALGGMVLLVGITAAGCGGSSNGDSKEKKFTAQSQGNFDTVQPPHMYDVSQARENLLAAQDAMAEGANSWTVQNTPGVGITFQCASRGMPIPFSAQITNPMKPDNSGTNTIGVPQQEPYGIYVPDATAATYANCVLPDGKLGVWYSEPPVTAFLFDVSCDKISCKVSQNAKATVSVTAVDPTKVCARPAGTAGCPKPKQ